MIMESSFAGLILMEKAHDNEADNEEYTARGEKYWKNSLKALKGEGTKTDDDVSD